MTATLYGVLIGILFVLFTSVVPQPIGSVILWGYFSVQLLWLAVLCWRRTGLPFATAAMITAGVISVCLTCLAVIGHPYPLSMTSTDPFLAWPAQSWILFAGGVALAPLFLLIESQVNRPKWRRWAEHMKRQHLWDILIGRHIPQLRDDA